MEEITLSRDQLVDLIKSAYCQGYSDHDTIEAGLEAFDPDSYVRWIISTKIK
jgi:hypothetical protein